MNRPHEPVSESTEVIRTVLNDETVTRLRREAERRGLELEELMAALLVAGSERVGELLGDPPPRRRT